MGETVLTPVACINYSLEKLNRKTAKQLADVQKHGLSPALLLTGLKTLILYFLLNSCIHVPKISLTFLCNSMLSLLNKEIRCFNPRLNFNPYKGIEKDVILGISAQGSQATVTLG